MTAVIRVSRIGFMQYDCSFYTGELSVDPAIAATGHEPNGYFWEGLLGFLAPRLSRRVELDSEAGMFSAFGRRRQMKRVQRLLAPYLSDADLVSQAIARAEHEGFDLGD